MALTVASAGLVGLSTGSASAHAGNADPDYLHLCMLVATGSLPLTMAA